MVREGKEMGTIGNERGNTQDLMVKTLSSSVPSLSYQCAF